MQPAAAAVVTDGAEDEPCEGGVLVGGVDDATGISDFT
jgi:hypothetical protein